MDHKVDSKDRVTCRRITIEPVAGLDKVTVEKNSVSAAEVSTKINFYGYVRPPLVMETFKVRDWLVLDTFTYFRLVYSCENWADLLGL